jgi:hypothetical protein
VVVDSCSFSDFLNAAVYGTDAEVRVEDSDIDMSGLSSGVWVTGSSHATVARDDIQCESATPGLGVAGGSGSTVDVTESVITGTYTGVDASGDNVSVSQSKISGFHNAGIKVTGGYAALSHDTVDVGSTGVTGIDLVSCDSAHVDHNVITGSSSGVRYGMKCYGLDTLTASYNTFEDVLTGMKVYGSSHIDVNHNVFSDNGSTGMSVEGTSWANVKHNSITGYAYYGVAVKNSAEADLGAYPDSGSNRIFTGSPWTDYCVMNKTAVALMAECNWWGTSQPTQSLFYGPVDWNPYLGSDPGLPFALRMPGLVFGVPPLAYSVQNYPNPLNPLTTIEYGVPEEGARVTLRVFDVSGRVVRVLVDGTRPAGVHFVSWDGCGDDGRRVASGVYLYEAVIGDYRTTKKMVVLR